MDVYFYEAFTEEAASLRLLIGDELEYDLTEKTIQEAGHLNPPARLISIRTQSIVPQEWAKDLDGIFSRSTGYDHLKKYLEKIRFPLPCGYLEEYATHAVAEHALLLTIALMRRLPQQIIQFKQFDRNLLTGNECGTKNILVVGVGRIGIEIIKKCSALGMNVKGVDIVRRYDEVNYIDKEGGITWADAVICSMNLTGENHGYFSYEFLKQAKHGIIFINIARGEHAPLAGLLKLAQENHLGGLGLDVFEDEPNIASAMRTDRSNADSRVNLIDLLLRQPNVILTPHNAFNTAEAVQRKSRMSIEEISYFLKNKNFRNLVV